VSLFEREADGWHTGDPRGLGVVGRDPDTDAESDARCARCHDRDVRVVDVKDATVALCERCYQRTRLGR